MKTNSYKLPSVTEIGSSVCDANFIGEGLNGKVYKVNGYPNYVLKLAKRHGEGGFSFAENVEPDFIESPLLHGRNFGQPVANYGENAQLLLFQRGVPCGVPEHLINNLPYCKKDNGVEEFLKHYDALSTPEAIAKQENADRIFETTLAQTAGVPLAGYIGLLEDLRFLNKNGMGLDSSRSGNLLIDVEYGKFGIVDLCFNGKLIVINYPFDVAFMICRQSYIWQFYLGGKQDEIFSNRRKVFYNVLTAAETLGVRFVGWDTTRPGCLLENTLKAIGIEDGSSEFKQIEDRIALTMARPKTKAVIYNRGMSL